MENFQSLPEIGRTLPALPIPIESWASVQYADRVPSNRMHGLVYRCEIKVAAFGSTLTLYAVYSGSSTAITISPTKGDPPYGHEVRDVAPFVRVEVARQAYARTERAWSGGTITYESEAMLPAKVQIGTRSQLLELGPFSLWGKGTFDVATGAVVTSFFGYRYSRRPDQGVLSDFRHILDTYASSVEGGAPALWKWWFSTKLPREQAGLKPIESRKDIKPVLERLEKEEPLLWLFFCWLHNKRNFEKTTNNKLLAAMLLRTGTDYEALRQILQKAFDNILTVEPRYGGRAPDGRATCKTFPGAAETIAEGQAKARWQFAKGARAQAEALGISPVRHPTLLACIEEGAIRMGTFHVPGQEDSLINVEFDLWEKALTRPGWKDTICEIARSAQSRPTKIKYSNRVTSYLAFLFHIERYLDKHAPRPNKNRKKRPSWQAMPRFVQSEWELEMDEATEEGTTKKRSAFTPVADNDKGTITVPYIAMRLRGERTTFCYSEIFFVAEEGQDDPVFPFGGTYESDLAEKLNGRDDYGLCLFTLTGSESNTGYPTFLIIFERTTTHGTKVHFHRVHPSRSRGPNGTATPPNRLIEECYRYMAGNIRAEDITHQQGDLLLVKAVKVGKGEPPVPVYGFENHTFESLSSEPVLLTRVSAKKPGNLLGWLLVPSGMRMPHPEHEPVEGIEPGIFELRRCKSWEANPTAVWVLNID